MRPQTSDGHIVLVFEFSKSFQLVCESDFSDYTYNIEGKGNEAMVSAQDTERLLPLHQREEVVCHRLTIEEVVDTKKKVPVRIKDSG